MIVQISDALQATPIFAVILFVAVLLTVRPKKKNEDSLFPISVTNELKGFAITFIVFAHVGFYLVSDRKFLPPLSYFAGAGVDIFLFTSGFGLTISALKKTQKVIEFYKTRLARLFIPFWVVITVLFIASAVILHLGYSLSYIIEAFLGIFLKANLYQDINSPLWYFTIILFYYLLFPIVFNRKKPWLSAIILLLIGIILIILMPDPLQNLIYLFRIHVAAFPLGVLFAWIFTEPKLLGSLTWSKIHNKYDSIKSKKFKYLALAGYYGFVAFLFYLGAHYGIYSGVGKPWLIEELIGLITTLSIILFFIFKNFQIKLFYLIGIFSYEIYLLHWPLGYRYGAFIQGLPSWLSLLIYLVIVFTFSFAFKKLIDFLTSRINLKI